MTKAELLECISNGENSGVEFKRDQVDVRSLAQELVAFANLNGGRILLGVADDGSIEGFTRPDVEGWVMTACQDDIRPPLIPYFEVVCDVQAGRHVAVIQVERGWAVHHVWHNNRRAYYIRVGSQSREASEGELARLFQQRGAFRPELRPVSGSSAADLDARRLRDHFGRVRQQETPPDTDKEGWRTLLSNTEFLSDSGGGAACTVAGLLLFGKNPNRYLPQSGIDAVAYPGVDKDYASLERASLRGSLVGLFNQGDGMVTMLEPGVVEQTVEFVRRNTGVKAHLENGARRVERAAYPEEAVREAVVNALVHRDYLLSATDVELSIYADRLEIISPGRLPNGVTTERMRAGCRAARNQLLKDVMRDYGYLEHMGMGVPRKIIRGMRLHNGTEPDLVADDEGERFTVRLWKENRS